MRLNTADADLWDGNPLTWKRVGWGIEAPIPGTNEVYRLTRTGVTDRSFDLYLDSGGPTQLMYRGSRAWSAAGFAALHYIRNLPGFDDQGSPKSSHCIKETEASLVDGLAFRDPVDPEMLRSTFQPGGIHARYI